MTPLEAFITGIGVGLASAILFLGFSLAKEVFPNQKGKLK